MANGGYQVLKNFISFSMLEALQHEATVQLQYAVRNEGEAVLPLPERGGQPSRRLYSGAGEKVLEKLYGDTNILRQLQKCTGLKLLPTSEQGSYSYYLHKGDYLSLHRDIHSCDVTLITTLYDQSFHNSKGGMLCMYPERRLEPLNHILKTKKIRTT